MRANQIILFLFLNLIFIIFGQPLASRKKDLLYISEEDGNDYSIETFWDFIRKWEKVSLDDTGPDEDLGIVDKGILSDFALNSIID